MIHIKYLNLFMKTEKIQKNIDLYPDNYWNYVMFKKKAIAKIRKRTFQKQYFR